jgi:outer membrane protein assembly factor BamB
VYSTPAISGGNLYIGNYQGEVYAFDARTGRRVWRERVGGTISGSPTVIGDVLYVSSLSGRKTYGLSPRNGRVLWTHPDGRYVSGIGTDAALYLSMGSTLSRWTTRATGGP